VAETLLSGAHNTLGRAAALRGQNAEAKDHFRLAVGMATTDAGERELLVHARSIREMAALGLLPQAASLVEREIGEISKLAERPSHTRAKIGVLKSETRLLKHELALAQQRGQLQKNRDQDAGQGRSIEQLKAKSVSQLGQDLWVLEQTGYKRGGFFVEFGATDGVLLSNTWLLEKEFGWRGICVEPNPALFEQLRLNRSCAVSDACIAGETGKEVDFVFADAFGSMAEYAASDHHAATRQAYAETGAVGKLKTTSLHDLLCQLSAPREIDYISIDTEGSELEILAAFPFDKWDVQLFTVEHNFTPHRGKLRELLSHHGYRCVEREWDDWYVKDPTIQA
jgi:FkbM family methyltransferase